MPDVAGEQARQTGRALQNASADIGRIAADMQQQADQLRVNDALNRVKEEALRLTYDPEVGFKRFRGRDALERPSGKPLADEYVEQLSKRIEDAAASLANDAQRQMFVAHANSIRTSFLSQALQHMASEYTTYGLSVAEGVQSTAMKEIALNWNNPEVIDKAIERIKAETYRQAQLLGKSAEWQEAAVLKLTSRAHKEALMAALENNDLLYADTYLKRYGEQMDMADRLTVQGHITKAVDATVAMTAAQEALQKAQPRIQPNELDRAFNILISAESGGRQFAPDGSPLASPKGAVGIAQVMPETAKEAAKLAGLPWDENRYRNDPEYNKALGLAYFQEMLRQNGGDLAKAYAAYNAGPGRLAEAIKRAEQAAKSAEKGPDGRAQTWLDFLPQETRDYVTKNMRAFEAGQGVPSRPTFAEIDEMLRADPRLRDNPFRYKAAREVAERLYNEQTKAIKQKEDEAVATAMRAILENGGSFASLPASIRAAVPPKEIDNLIDFARKIAKGEDTTDLWLYARLAGKPEALAGMSDAEFYKLRSSLSEADFKHFANERAKLLGKSQGNAGPGDLNTQAINQELTNRLRMIGIDPTPKDNGGKDAARVGAIRQFVNQYFYAAQREAGRKFTDAEVAQHLDALFAKNATFRGFFSDSSGPMLTMKVGDIDSATRKAIKEAYKRRGVDSPTDAQILLAYWQLQMAKKP
jgi:soluble lytic murein transglycosylase